MPIHDDEFRDLEQSIERALCEFRRIADALPSLLMNKMQERIGRLSEDYWRIFLRANGFERRSQPGLN